MELCLLRVRYALQHIDIIIVDANLFLFPACCCLLPTHTKTVHQYTARSLIIHLAQWTLGPAKRKKQHKPFDELEAFVLSLSLVNLVPTSRSNQQRCTNNKQRRHRFSLFLPRPILSSSLRPPSDILLCTLLTLSLLLSAGLQSDIGGTDSLSLSHSTVDVSLVSNTTAQSSARNTTLIHSLENYSSGSSITKYTRSFTSRFKATAVLIRPLLIRSTTKQNTKTLPKNKHKWLH